MLISERGCCNRQLFPSPPQEGRGGQGRAGAGRPACEEGRRQCSEADVGWGWSAGDAEGWKAPTVLGGAGARGGAATSRWQRALPRASPLCPFPAAAAGLLRGSWILDAALHRREPGLLGKRLVPGQRHSKSAICCVRWEMALQEQSGHDRRA